MLVRRANPNAPGTFASRMLIDKRVSMKKKLFWAVVALLALTVTVLIAAWPRYLPVIRMHGEPDHLAGCRREIFQSTFALYLPL